MFVSADWMSFVILKCMSFLLHISDMDTRATLSGADAERWDMICSKLSNPADTQGIVLREMTAFLRVFTEV